MSYSLSVCLMVKNAEKTLLRCLTQAQKVATEILILDTGSTDNTPSIAKAHADIFFETPWNDHFSQPRNMLLEKASCEWILILDGDEYLSERFIECLPHILTQYHQQAVLLSLAFRYASGKTERVARLFPGPLHLRFKGRVHEYLHSPQNTFYKKIHCPQLIVHHQSDQPQEKTDYYQFLIQQELKELSHQQTMPQVVLRQANLYYYLAKTAHQAQKPLEAYQHYARALSLLNTQRQYPLRFLHSVLLPMSRLGADLSGHFILEQEHFAVLEQITGVFPDFAEGWLHLGYAYKHKNKSEKAKMALQKCLELLDKKNSTLPLVAKEKFRSLCHQALLKNT